MRAFMPAGEMNFEQVLGLIGTARFFPSTGRKSRFA
jgi:hypothetical protein